MIGKKTLPISPKCEFQRKRSLKKENKKNKSPKANHNWFGYIHNKNLCMCLSEIDPVMIRLSTTN